MCGDRQSLRTGRCSPLKPDFFKLVKNITPHLNSNLFSLQLRASEITLVVGWLGGLVTFYSGLLWIPCDEKTVTWREKTVENPMEEWDSAVLVSCTSQTHHWMIVWNDDNEFLSSSVGNVLIELLILSISGTIASADDENGMSGIHRITTWLELCS